MSVIALFGSLLLAGCDSARSPAAALAYALASDTPADRALEACADAGQAAEECVATVIRAHPDEDPDRCDTIKDARWRGECWFSVAEHRAASGSRWEALAACGKAGRFYDECLYHAWTLEFQGLAGSAGRAVDRMDAARPAFRFWSEIQTVGPDPRRQIEDDWWYFAHARNRPARLADCAALPDPHEADACARGTRQFVRRVVVEFLTRPGTPRDQADRVCRGGADDARAIIGDFYTSDADLDAVLRDALAEGCARAADPTNAPPRPWNPVFRARSPGVAG